MSQQEPIEGVVERIAFANQDNGWSVIRLKVRGRGKVTAVGKLLGVQVGETLRLGGDWVNNKRFGEQFEVASFVSVRPSTYLGIERYLGSGLVEGIGRGLAKKLVAHFGLDTLDVIDRQPERLREVEGIGAKRSRRIVEAWGEQREIREVMVFLQSHGVQSGHAVKIFKRYGAESIARVRENPYRLAEEVWGIGFLTADKIAADLGLARDSPLRAAAGVLHTLRRAAEQGHVFQPRQRLVETSMELLQIEESNLNPALDRLLERGDLAAEPFDSPREGPPGEQAIFLAPLATAEHSLAQRLRALTAQRELPLRIDIDKAVSWFEDAEGIRLAAQQRQALARATIAKVMVLTGGPGTGKTTLLRAIVRVLQRKHLQIVLAAPTGRAAKRLAEVTGMEAKTVHRLLEYNPVSRQFSRGLELPLAADLVVIDEASMLDTVLAQQVLSAVPDKARLLLVGDVDQLPSVGPGRVLEDLIRSDAVEVVRLTEVFRQAQKSLIVVNAHRVLAGQLPELRRAEDGADFFFIERQQSEAVLDTLLKVVAKRVPSSFALDPRRQVQVLTPMRRGLLGATNLNAELQALLNPDGPAVSRGARLLRRGDRVMQQRNNYDLEVFNGDIGLVHEIDSEDSQLTVDFDGRLVTYDFNNLEELVLAYACSIHKSQGSEYPCVVLPLHTQHYVMLQRNLLYTGLTRGKRLVVIIGSKRALEIAIHTTTATHRATLLERRLRA